MMLQYGRFRYASDELKRDLEMVPLAVNQDPFHRDFYTSVVDVRLN
jgi:hypothetical protein